MKLENLIVYFILQKFQPDLNLNPLTANILVYFNPHDHTDLGN